MEERIIYRTEGTQVALMTPIAGCGLTPEEIAAKDVPEGHPWRIMLLSELPPFEIVDQWRWTEAGPLDIEQAV